MKVLRKAAANLTRACSLPNGNRNRDCSITGSISHTSNLTLPYASAITGEHAHLQFQIKRQQHALC